MDVGAHLGWFTCIVGKCCPKLPVIALEMHEDRYRALKKNVAINGLTNVEMHHAAASRTSSTVRYVRDRGIRAPILRPSNASAAAVEVRSLRLDQLLPTAEEIVVKIDVEGAEGAVLRGMKGCLHRTTAILLELHPKKLRDLGGSIGEIHQILTENGFTTTLVPDFRRGGQAATAYQSLPVLRSPREYPNQDVMVFARRP